MIEARGLSMRYGAVAALEDATFKAARGEVVGLLGPNGAGKTTTMRILTTYQHPSAGSATVAGHDVVAEPLEVRRRTGYLPEALPLYLSMEVRECISFVGRARGLRGRELRERVDWAVAKCGLDRMFRTPAIQLSKGYRQRTGLAQALVHDPDVVILDEPTSGLDPHQILEIRELIRELAQTRTVMLSTHILQEANALADRLIVLSRGRIVGQGTADELRTQAGIHPRVRVVLRTDDAQAARAALAALPAAGDVTPAESGSDVTPGFEIVESAAELLGEIGDLAHGRGWAVRELHREAGSLEDMFLALTRADWGAEEALAHPERQAAATDDTDTAGEAAA